MNCSAKHMIKALLSTPFLNLFPEMRTLHSAVFSPFFCLIFPLWLLFYAKPSLLHIGTIFSETNF